MLENEFWIWLVIILGFICYLGFIDVLLNYYYKKKKHQKYIDKDQHNRENLLKDQIVNRRIK